MAGSESQKRGHQKPLLKVFSGDHRILEMAGLWDACQGQGQVQTEAGPSLGDKLCVLGVTELEKLRI